MENKLQNRDPNKSSIGPMVGAIIIVLVLILGALYTWGERLSKVRTIQTIQNS